MLTTKQAVFRKYWHAIIAIQDLIDGPKPFRLMGVDIVLFLDEAGQPRALRDRCCHRTARLSKGWCDQGRIVCGYHGWTFAGDGKLVRVPQLDGSRPVPKAAVEAYWCMQRFGYAWVSLEEPCHSLFDIPEDRDPAFRRIFQFYETWNTAPLRLMENSFDNAHFAFVHQSTFGDAAAPTPVPYRLTETDYGFCATSTVDVVNPPDAHQVTGSTEPRTQRQMQNHWYLPFCRRLDITYPSGVRHIIVNSATPIDDDRIQLVQWLFRNDREQDCPAVKLIEWDRKVITEDRDILESTDPDTPLDRLGQCESHMASDRPGLVMRRRLLSVLHEHGEQEIRATA